ncbi:MAG: TatD family hydrolase [Chloroflexi bacterium]|nr:TatD family hydrolase [Chloroflexota bacterium]
MLADCHTHIDQYAPAELPGVLHRAQEAGVGAIIAAGTTLDSCRRVLHLAASHPPLYAGIGLHPMHLTAPVDDAMYAALRSMASGNPKVVVMSEIGLDFMSGAPPRELQDQAFRAQVRLALELGLPIVFHSRESHTEVLRTLRQEGSERVGGAMHYFQADLATALEAMDAGFFISLARPLLRLPDLQETARRLPLDRIVLESDAAPQPFKKKRDNWTEPRHVRDVAAKLAELKDIPLEEVEAATAANLDRMLQGRIAALRS